MNSATNTHSQSLWRKTREMREDVKTFKGNAEAHRKKARAALITAIGSVVGAAVELFVEAPPALLASTILLGGIAVVTSINQDQAQEINSRNANLLEDQINKTRSPVPGFIGSQR